MAVDSEARPPDPSRIPSSILGSISLFIPHPVVSTLTESRRDDRRIALEDPISLSDEEEGTMAMRVTEALAEDAHPRVLLVTGIDTATSRPTVFGAYFPSESTGNVQLLFQLRPRFHLHNISIAGDSLSPILLQGFMFLSTTALRSVLDNQQAKEIASESTQAKGWPR